ncbi:MAG: hypothetical protein PHT69_02175 [Bacteroidales bacterium]|nr:hypothetical protein [Bacteroidales bacterium]
MKKIKIGIIATDINRDDVLFYKEQLVELTTKLKGIVKLIIYGYNGEEGEEDWLEGVDFDFVKPTSIIHFPKQLKALELDLILIPLIPNSFNSTSEDYTKFLEAAIFSIPVLTPNIYPYNGLIQDGINGYIFSNKKDLTVRIQQIIDAPVELKMAGAEAKKIVENNFDFSEENNIELTKMF